MRVPRVHVQIDVDPAALSRVYPATHQICGDSRRLVPLLVSTLGSTRAEASWVARVSDVRAQVRSDLATAIGPQALICQAIRDVLPREAVLARDVTIPASSWGNRLLPVYDARTNIFARGGGIGQGLGMGIGAALSRPGVPTVVIAGDGGLAVHLGELMTLAQEGPPLVLLVFNDYGYGVLRNMQEQDGGRRAGVDLHTPDFEQLAAAAALPYHLIKDAADAHHVLAAAVQSRRPCLVEVDVAAIGAMQVPFTPPVDVPK
jgi:acetolactate synthase-1/2/3 large subunit